MAITFPYNNDYQPAAPVITVSLQRRKSVTIAAMIDTGADNSIFPIDQLLAAGATYVGSRRLVGVTGHKRLVDLYGVEVQIGNYRIPGVRAVAIDPGEEALIGRDILTHLIVMLNGIMGITEIS